MGAEPWQCIVPYQPDMRAALKQAREQTFDSGEYDRAYPELDFLDGMNFFGCSDEEREDYIVRYGLDPLGTVLKRVGPGGFRQWLLDTYAAQEIANLDDLAALQCLSSDGTRSVLDISDISDKREAGCAAPLTSDDLLALYGTEQPTWEMAKHNEDYYDDIGRGEAIYFVLYRNDQPNEILFAGYSYD